MTLLDYVAKNSQSKIKVDISSKSKLTYKKAFNTWQSILTERVINIFRWNGIDFPQREIEILLCLIGFCGFTKFKKVDEYGSVYGSMSGVTNYPDLFTTFTYATPLESGMKKIDKNLVVINNNEIRMPSVVIVNNYAHLLAHADLSLQALLINCRSGGIVKASTQKQVDSVNNWYNSLYNGNSVAILDEDSMDSFIDTKSMDFLQTVNNTRVDINDYYLIRENLLKSFYADMGISGTREKKAHLLNDEIYTDINRVIFNVNDMLNERKEACEKINNLFGLNVTVEFNDEIQEQIDAMQNNDETGSGENDDMGNNESQSEPKIDA